MDNFRKNNGIRRRILIVEDEAVNRDILGWILEEEYEVFYAENGQIAYDMIKEEEQTFSLILLDIMMPEMDGYTLLQLLKKDEKYKYIPVIVLTAEKNAEVKSIKLGAADFIKKPYDMPEVIMARCERIIELYEDQRIIRSTEKDTLTGLYAKNYFYEYIKQIEDIGAGEERDAIVINVEHFSLINELYGHDEGDNVLKDIAKILTDVFADIRTIICRFESDTFCIYCDHQEDYSGRLKSIQARLDELKGSNRIRIRVGINSNDRSEASVATRFDRAKSACDRVRGDYTHNMAYYSNDLLKQAIYNERLINEIEGAIHNGDFVVYYQPKYTISGDKPVLKSAEALIRWKHPEMGMISPGEFIPLFENNGLIQELDSYVWWRAAKQIREWKDKIGKAVPVSVNVSRIDIYNPELEEYLLGLLEKNKINADELMLEITESAYSENADRLLEVVNNLKAKGFKIEMDDFGSGYSSLNMLTAMPIDVLKMDMGFVKNVTKDEKSKRLVELIISIAKYLNLTVVAEGVEEQEQLDILRDMGCDVVQGFYFSKPLPPEEFEELLKKG
ncbi:MAG: EAL domain-containing protein [Lachnospiraceae bacterium]|nr:EAL domain-containing protein [Lachnospiraceae bacterium]